MKTMTKIECPTHRTKVRVSDNFDAGGDTLSCGCHYEFRKGRPVEWTTARNKIPSQSYVAHCAFHGETIINFASERSAKNAMMSMSTAIGNCGCGFKFDPDSKRLPFRFHTTFTNDITEPPFRHNTPTNTIGTNAAGRKDDDGKPAMDLLPYAELVRIGEVLAVGAKKYAPNNWQLVPDAVARYEAAMMRHFAAYKEGQPFDRDDGLSHLAHAATNILFLMWFESQKLKE
jgi:hypothetical protein